MVVADVYLGKSAIKLKDQHNEIELDNSVINKKINKTALVFIDPKVKSYWLDGTIVQHFNYITYVKPSYKINSFGVSLRLDSYPPMKVKDTLVSLFELPLKGWNIKKSVDPKYGENTEYKYSCSQYEISINQSGFGTTLQLNEK
ncbi:hypothetical protein [Acinetobacter guillouiae]|uniref:hypothetical protein n=1 Tax=Acinetobacter guillouiae TaxID=106649 RepID=UPI003D00442A